MPKSLDYKPPEEPNKEQADLDKKLPADGKDE